MVFRIPNRIIQFEEPASDFVEGFLSWETVNPSSEYIVYGQESAINYLNDVWGHVFADAYRKLLSKTHRERFFALCFVSERGGLYVARCVRPQIIDDWLDNIVIFGGSNLLLGSVPLQHDLMLQAHYALSNILNTKNKYGFSPEGVIRFIGPKIPGSSEIYNIAKDGECTDFSSTASLGLVYDGHVNILSERQVTMSFCCFVSILLVILIYYILAP